MVENSNPKKGWTIPNRLPPMPGQRNPPFLTESKSPGHKLVNIVKYIYMCICIYIYTSCQAFHPMFGTMSPLQAYHSQLKMINPSVFSRISLHASIAILPCRVGTSGHGWRHHSDRRAARAATTEPGFQPELT